MREEERKEFLVWYNNHKSEPFDNRRILETYFQVDVAALRQACRVFRRDFMQICNIEVFLESITVSSAWNKVLQKRF